MKIGSLTEKELRKKIQSLRTWVWGTNLDEPRINRWLSNFKDSGNGPGCDIAKQQHLALFLLSSSTYFNLRELRAMIRSAYRDLVEYPAIQQIRSDSPGISIQQIELMLSGRIKNTIFIPIGNPSESGAHILYYFRQENRLRVSNFAQGIELFERHGEKLKLKFPKIEHYIFIDDICGSGRQAAKYGETVCKQIRKLNPQAQLSFLALVATEEGLSEASSGGYGKCEAVFSLDQSFKSMGSKSRYFELFDDGPEMKSDALKFIRHYGKKLSKDHPLGMEDGQLLLSFAHNTPNNTLPIFWSEKSGWQPLMKRFGKSLR